VGLVEVQAPTIDVIDTIGAGDSFQAFAHSWISCKRPIDSQRQNGQKNRLELSNRGNLLKRKLCDIVSQFQCDGKIESFLKVRIESFLK